MSGQWCFLSTAQDLSLSASEGKVEQDNVIRLVKNDKTWRHGKIVKW